MALSNFTFTVAAVKKESAWITACALENGARKTENCTLPGLSVEAMTLLSKTLGFQYETLWVKSYADLEWTILSGRADFSLSFLAAGEDRWKIFKFLEPLNFLFMGFMGKLPQPSMVPMPLLRPFDIRIWIALLIAFFTLLFMLFLTSKSRPARLPSIFFRLLAFTLRQQSRLTVPYSPWHQGHIWLRLSSTLYSTLLMLLGILYASSFIAFLYPVQKGHPFHDINSLADIISSGRFTLYVSGYRSLFFHRIGHSDLPSDIKMIKALMKHKPVFYTSHIETMPGLLANERLITPSTWLTYSYLTRSIADACAVEFVHDQTVSVTWESIIMRKDFPYAKLFSETMKSGVRDVTWAIAKRDYYFRYFHNSICSRGATRIDHATGLDPHLPVFQFWCFAMLISVMAFLLERSWAACGQVLDSVNVVR